MESQSFYGIYISVSQSFYGGGGGVQMHISRAMTTTIRFSMCGSFAMNARGSGVANEVSKRCGYEGVKQ